MVEAPKDGEEVLFVECTLPSLVEHSSTEGAEDEGVEPRLLKRPPVVSLAPPPPLDVSDTWWRFAVKETEDGAASSGEG